MAYLDDMNQVWEMVRSDLREEYGITVSDLWFGGLKVLDFSGSTLTLQAESQFKIRVLTSKYKESLEIRMSQMLGFGVTIAFVSAEEPEPTVAERFAHARVKEPTPASAAWESPNSPIGSTLPPFNFEYTFDNFIVGSTNKFAHAACLAVAEQPAKTWNPLFIYGPSGLGKTHLLYAITNELKKKMQDVRVIYIKGEDFTNQMIDSLSRQAMNEFRDKYRSCDVLLIDDIHFIAGKTSTQEEFFHTFNALHEAGKQIILTSDSPPREIKTLEDRLKTRFEWGLTADIQPPDLELRTAIIKKKAEQVNISVPDDVLNFLAENLRSNIRQIEGAIKKLGAKSFVTGEPISMDLARSCISDLLDDAEPIGVTVDKVFAAIFKKYNISQDDIKSSNRKKEVAQARHVAIYVLRTLTGMSQNNLSKIVNRDRTTVLSSIEKMETDISKNVVFRTEIEELIKEIKGN